MSKLKVGMISFAHGHAGFFLHWLLNTDGVQVVGIADEQEDRVKASTDMFNIPYYADYHELLRTDVDAVVICSENAHHARITIDTARAGKHILCEKPLGVTMDEMEEMILACKQNDVQLMTAFPCRFAPGVQEAKEAVDRGEIGEILAIKGYNRGSFPDDAWFTDKSLSGGGAIIDHTVHVMDLMLWFLDSPVEEVYAEVDHFFREQSEIDDAGIVHVKFANGTVGVLDPSWSRSKSFPHWGDVAMEIIGTKGVLSVNAFTQKFDLYSDEAMKAQWVFWGTDINQQLIKAFVQSLQSGAPVPINGEDGMAATSVALAAYESANINKPVRL